MKQILAFLLPLICLTGIFQCQAQAQSSEIKIFSKYNYYTQEQYASVIGIFPNEAASRNFHMECTVAQKGIWKAPSVNGTSTVRIPLKSLPVDTTNITVRVLSGNTVIKDTIIELVRLKPAPHEVKIDRVTGGLVVDGLPFFPVGFYCGKVGKLPEEEVGNEFNMIGPYQSNLPSSLPERKAYMARFAQLGIKVQYSVNSLIGLGHNGAKGLNKTEAEKLQLLKNEVLTFRNHPALLSWYINDEPAGQGRPSDVLEKAYRLIHKLDPYHPVSVVFMMPSKANKYRKTMDIAMTDPYPIPQSVSGVSDYVRQMQKYFRHEKSVWLVPQAFGGQEMWPREPTAKEIRVMTYLGIIDEAKGIQYFIHTGQNLNPQSVSAWSECRDMAAEINQMTPFLLSDEKTQQLSTDNPEIVARSFSYRGDKLIVTVNQSNQPTAFSIGGVYSPTHQAEGWFENRTIGLHNDTIRDIIDALGTRIYLIRKTNTQDNRAIDSHNLVYNPSFEKVASPGLAEGHHLRFRDPEKADPGATVFADSRQSVDGLFSLRLVTPTDSSGKCVQFLPIAIKKGNTYHVSIWGKAKQQEKMPAFHLSVNGDGKTIIHTFRLTPQWKKYSFIVPADSLSSNVIIQLELINRGTAWFDLMQMTPEPFLSYSMNLSEQKATVSVGTNIESTEIKYQIVGSPRTQSPRKAYKEPFAIKKAATVIAEVYKNGKELARSKIFIPVNKALGKTVRFETKYSDQYSARGDSSLTDGLTGSTAFKDGRWLGFTNPEVSFVVDMKKPTAIHQVIANFLCDPNSGIFVPKGMKVYTSLDSLHFHLAGTTEYDTAQRRNASNLIPLTVDIPKTNARYIRVVIQPFGVIPEGYLFKGTDSWLFTDEFMVH
ncbi:hypothetical protein PbJCM13498_07710 [Prolixibacter bellariivorans]|uniref:CBM-cenC domain-containing protein n=1 Tax=Prolixibacter bellariivorans TaxID=314319 RepID=A0A5M4AW86_9BACT|nr:carbohydrate binding domain-containing protein [Prolixibacter bellariivorans]GET31908.1 hypothetical protein PbJCM13498_07710 [Prolixibacter bellariivorans]